MTVDLEEVDVYGPFIKDHNMRIREDERKKILDELLKRAKSDTMDSGIHHGWILFKDLEIELILLRSWNP